MTVAGSRMVEEMGVSEAVVVGASMAGLSATAALAEEFDRVRVVERDRLPREATHRKGVPQDRHLHLLLPGGASALEELLPGVLGEMVDAGAESGDADRIRLSLDGHRLAPAKVGNRAVFASRPFVEAHVRRRVRQLPGVQVMDGRVVRSLTTSDDGQRVTGVRVSAERGDEEVLPADLVVDCSGRGSRTPAWLEELGYGSPDVDELRVDVQYATRTFALSSDALDGDLHVLVGPTPDGPRGGAMTHVAADRWLVTLFAMGGDPPVPEGDGGFQRFAARLPIPDIHDAVVAGEPVDPTARYRFAANRRRRYERSGELPAGLLVAGDAVCSFNPIYGQGMSVAALEAVALRRLLAGPGSSPDPNTWFATIAPIVDGAWDLAVGGDLAVDRIEGRRPLPVRFGNAYLRWFHAAATTDPTLTRRFVRVAGLLDPPKTLLHPAAVGRVLWGRLRRSRPRRRQNTS